MSANDVHKVMYKLPLQAASEKLLVRCTGRCTTFVLSSSRCSNTGGLSRVTAVLTSWCSCHVRLPGQAAGQTGQVTWS